MYIIIERERLPQGRHYETMPDGRCVVGGSEAKMMDTLEGVTVVPTSEALERLRRQIAREMGLTEETPQEETPQEETPREDAPQEETPQEETSQEAAGEIEETEVEPEEEGKEDGHEES